MAFAFGLAIATLAQCIGQAKGKSLLASCQISVLKALFYIIAQVLGAVVGSAIVYGIRPETTDSLGVNKVRKNPCASNFPE